MFDFPLRWADLVWPLTIFIGWLAGEIGHLWLRLPRISVYALVGFLVSPIQAGILSTSHADAMLLIANIAFGLILFECGYRINLRWLRANPWIPVTSLVESLLTFFAVCFFLLWLEQSVQTALLLAALAMATSPATIMRVVNEQRSSGQVTERVLHFSALNCVLAVLIFKLVVGVRVFEISGKLLEALYSSFFVLITSAALGVVFGFFIPAFLRITKRAVQDSTLAFTVAVICVVALAHELKLSPVLAALTFGVTARHRRIVLGAAQRGFGTIGDLMTVVLFVYIAAVLDWRHVTNGWWIGLAIIGIRQLAKLLGIGLFSHVSGISMRKGLLVGIAMAPMSAFVILVMEQTKHLGIDLVNEFAHLAGAALMLEIMGPIFIQRALIWSREASATGGR